MTYSPYPYQEYCLDRIISQKCIALWLDMGLGKTVITLTAIVDLIYFRFEVSKVLIVAPKKVAEATWQDEAAKWDQLSYLRISTIMGLVGQRITAAHAPADIYVINRDNLAWLVDYFRGAWPYDMVVLDESTTYKNPSSKRFRAMRAIMKKVSRLVELTGTPGPQGLIDLWAQTYLLDGGERLGKTITGYRERYFLPDKRSAAVVYSYRPKPDADVTIRALLSDVVVSMRAADYLPMPGRVDVSVPVLLDAQSQARYDRLERDMLVQVDADLVTAQSAATLRIKLLQLCNGAVYGEGGGIVEVHGCKLAAFGELLEGLNGSPVLVFYAFRHDRERIMRLFVNTTLRVREYKSSADCAEWDRGKVDVLLAHPASCAYGLNLQHGGHNIIWYGLTDNLELYQQGNARLHRQGQGHPVVVHHLVVKGGVDEDVMANINRKAGTQDMLLEAMKARICRVKGL